MSEDSKTLLFVGSLDDVSGIDTLHDIDVTECTILAFGLEVEEALKARSLSYVSAGDYRAPTADSFIAGEKWSARILESDAWKFFRYRNVDFSQVYFLSLQGYFTHLLYYVDIVARVQSSHHATRLIAFLPTDPGPRQGSVLARDQIRVLPAAVAAVARERLCEVQLINRGGMVVQRKTPLSFRVQQFGIGVLLSILNLGVGMLRRRQKIRVLAADYWKNLSPYITLLPSAEIVQIDRRQATLSGWSNIWKFRMRFVSLGRGSQRTSEGDAEGLRMQSAWKEYAAGPELDAFVLGDIGMRPELTHALERIMEGATTDGIQKTDEAHALLKRTKPDIVVLRSTISTQAHFVVLAMTAKSLGIPSLEMQHGLEYYGPGAVHLRHRAEYTGVYGPHIEEQMKQVGDTATNAIPVGSPRFDGYAELATKRTTRSSIEKVVIIAPAIDPGGDSPDSYETRDYYRAVAACASLLPNAKLIVKLRPGENREGNINTTLAQGFGEVSYVAAQRESLAELYADADLVISCYSTALIEAMQSGIPCIYLGLSPSQSLMGKEGFATYANEGALSLATTESELRSAIEKLTKEDARTAMSAAAAQVLARDYLFDGKASGRAATLVEKLSQASAT